MSICVIKGTKKVNKENNVNVNNKKVVTIHGKSHDSNADNKKLSKNGSIVENIYNSTKTIMNESIDKDSFMISILCNDKKKAVGTISASVKITSKKTNRFRVLLFVINNDRKSKLNHVLIIDNNYDNPSVLFSTTEKDPSEQIKKYVPTILKSAQGMISNYNEN